MIISHKVYTQHKTMSSCVSYLCCHLHVTSVACSPYFDVELWMRQWWWRRQSCCYHFVCSIVLECVQNLGEEKTLVMHYITSCVSCWNCCCQVSDIVVVVVVVVFFGHKMHPLVVDFDSLLLLALSVLLHLPPYFSVSLLEKWNKLHPQFELTWVSRKLCRVVFF